MLPDLLADNLRLVICGSAAGTQSAAVGHYYAGPGNALWRTLHDVHLTPRQLKPEEWRQLLEYRIGLTDLVKNQAGADEDIRFDGGAELRRKIERYAPGMLVFNGKRAAKEYLGQREVDYGLVSAAIGRTRLFVCPSTSAAARGSWDFEQWIRMAELV